MGVATGAAISAVQVEVLNLAEGRNCYVPDYFGGLVLEEIVEVEPWFSDFFVGCRARGDSVN